jgi:predicted DNA-binding antitoxin AbrB/MazE fold protein
MPITYDENGVIKPNQTRNLTEEQVIEILRCKQDIKYFANNYYKVISDAGEHVINLREFQERLLEHFVGNRHKVVMSGRQSGKCVQSQQYVEILDKISGKIEKIEIGEFFNMIKSI